MCGTFAGKRQLYATRRCSAGVDTAALWEEPIFDSEI